MTLLLLLKGESDRETNSSQSGEQTVVVVLVCLIRRSSAGQLTRPFALGFFEIDWKKKTKLLGRFSLFALRETTNQKKQKRVLSF